MMKLFGSLYNAKLLKHFIDGIGMKTTNAALQEGLRHATVSMESAKRVKRLSDEAMRMIGNKIADDVRSDEGAQLLEVIRPDAENVQRLRWMEAVYAQNCQSIDRIRRDLPKAVASGDALKLLRSNARQLVDCHQEIRGITVDLLHDAMRVSDDPYFQRQCDKYLKEFGAPALTRLAPYPTPHMFLRRAVS